MELAMDLGILDPVEHARLLLDIDNIRDTANIPMEYLTRSMTNYCAQPDVDWVRGFKQHNTAGIHGLVMVGSKDADSRMMAMCGALLRNFIDARVIPLNTLMALQKDDSAPMPTALFIPNLYLDSFGKSLSSWQVQTIYDLLLQRLGSGKQTILYIESLDGFRNLYGQVALDHLEKHYTMVN
jgi:hypothetical protein